MEQGRMDQKIRLVQSTSSWSCTPSQSPRRARLRQRRQRQRQRQQLRSSRPAVLRVVAMALLLSCLVERRPVVVHAFQPAGTGARRQGWHNNVRPHNFCPTAVRFDNRKFRIKLFSGSSSSSSIDASSTEVTNVGSLDDPSLVHGEINGGATVNGKSIMSTGSSPANGGVESEDESHHPLTFINGDVSESDYTVDVVPSSEMTNKEGGSLDDGLTHNHGSAPVKTKSALNSSSTLNGSSLPNGTSHYEIPSVHTVDVPMPTENGGYTHTTVSRAKISAANKGKVPWNKGKARSEETRALIAAGVRATNRERFLQKLRDLGVTEEEYERDKREERRKKDAERRARQTLKGGYRPTNETRQKISTVLKEKWARGEMKRGPVHPDRVRRGFTHTEETRAKISASLKQLWAKDPDYRANMVKKSHASNSKEQVKRRISVSLKEKWQDPEFRARMLERMQASRTYSGPHDLSHREKISQAMKKKWQDEEYRQKTLGAIEKRRNQMVTSAPPPRKTKVAKKTPKKIPGERKSNIRAVQPVQAGVHSMPQQNVAKKRKKRIRSEDGNVVLVTKKDVKVKHEPSETMDGDKPEDKPLQHEPKNGSIQRLREERRDLYDLLYGEEVNGATALGDENLDTFDPYGLDDF